VQAPIVSMETVLGGQGDGPKFLVASSLLGDALIPLSSSFDYRIETRYADPTGLVTVATNENVRVAPGTVTSFALVDPPRYQVKSLPPILLTDIRFDFGEDPLTATPRIIISTVNLLLTENPYPAAPDFIGDSLEDVYLTIEIGGRDTFDGQGNFVAVGGRDLILPGTSFTDEGDGTYSAQLPAGAMVAGGYVTVSRRSYAPLDGTYEIQTNNSNPVQLIPTALFSVAVNSGDGTVSVTDSTTQAEIARVALEGADLAPRNSTFSFDNTRVYVALSGGAGIAAIDMVALQTIDANPLVEGVQHIALPAGAVPFDVVAEQNGRFLYVSDENKGVVYVIDIDPLSKNFHRHVRTIAVGPAPLGLRGLALNADNSLLYVTAPGRTLFGQFGADNGHVFVIETNAASRGTPRVLTQAEGGVIQVGPEPYDITATDDPEVMLLVDRVDDSRGVGVLRTRTVNDTRVSEINYVSLVGYGMVPRL